MRRIIRIGFVAAVLVAALGVTRPSNALQMLTWEFVVDCANPAGSDTGPTFDMPNGWYAVTVEGACIVDAYTTVPPGTVTLPPGYTFTTGTPCNVPLTGTPITCVTGGPNVSNVPGPFCQVVTAGVNVYGCLGGLNVTPTGCNLAIQMDHSACISNNAAGTFYHNPGPMNAKFADSYYGDNAGFFLVTVEWTHL